MDRHRRVAPELAVEPDVANQYHSGAVYNYSGFSDPEADRLLDQIALSFDGRERAALRRKIHARLHAEVPCTFLLANATTVGISKDIANVKIHDLGVRWHDFVMRDRWR